MSRLHVDQGERRVLVDWALKYECTHGTKIAVTDKDGREINVEVTVVALPAGDDKLLLVIAQRTKRRDWKVGQGARRVTVLE